MKLLSASLLSFLFATASLFGDSVVMKDGRTIEGSITSMGEGSVTINSGGIEMTIQKSEIKSMHFGESTAEGAPAAAPAYQQATAPAAQPAATFSGTIPAGAVMTVSIQSSLSSNGSRSGQEFRGVTVGDVRVGEQVVIPSGSAVAGQVVVAKSAGRGFRKTPGQLEIALNSVTINGKVVPIQTLPVNEESQRKRGSLMRGAGKGAALGALGGQVANDDAGDGAATGAAVGAAAGFLRRGQEVEISTGSVLAFDLRYAVKL